ncbi:MAG: hypothetical protein AAGU76_12165 [Sedimentibacter sp.]|uniref:hypothetical protein n=1 Tax=Sedimentibacter sp. TaxID=1960295 RepID=UPI003158F62F
MKYVKEIRESAKLVFFCCIGTAVGTIAGRKLMPGIGVNAKAVLLGELGAFVILTAAVAIIKIVRQRLKGSGYEQ